MAPTPPAALAGAPAPARTHCPSRSVQGPHCLSRAAQRQPGHTLPQQECPRAQRPRRRHGARASAKRCRRSSSPRRPAACRAHAPSKHESREGRLLKHRLPGRGWGTAARHPPMQISCRDGIVLTAKPLKPCAFWPLSPPLRACTRAPLELGADPPLGTGDRPVPAASLMLLARLKHRRREP